MNINQIYSSPVLKPKRKRTLLWSIFGSIMGILLLIALWPASSKQTKSESSLPPSSSTHLTPPQLIIKPPAPVKTMEPQPDGQLEKMRDIAPMSSTNKTNSPSSAAPSPLRGDSNTQFLQSLSTTETPLAKANPIKNLSNMIAQGAIIHATLESRIVSDLPGMTRAITSHDIYSEDGATLLIPKGSRLVGYYTNQIHHGQNRVFVVWQRLIRTDGVAIQLSSPSSDNLGSTGLAATHINHHFVEQFGMATMLSLISAGSATIGVQQNDTENAASIYRQSVAESFADTANTQLQQRTTIAPTLTIHQGTPITILVARDLDFS